MENNAYGRLKLPLRVLALFSLGFVMVVTASCSAIRAQSAYQNTVNQRVSNYTYQTDMNKVWEETKNMMFDMGYMYDEGRTGDLVLTTDWKVTTVTESMSGQETGQKRIRYMVRGTRMDNGGKMEIRKQVETRNREVVDRTVGGAVYGDYTGTWSDGTTERDLDMEFMLIRRVEPQRAAEIERAANVAADKARAETD